MMYIYIYILRNKVLFISRFLFLTFSLYFRCLFVLHNRPHTYWIPPTVSPIEHILTYHFMSMMLLVGYHITYHKTCLVRIKRVSLHQSHVFNDRKRPKLFLHTWIIPLKQLKLHLPSRYATLVANSFVHFIAEQFRMENAHTK